MEIIGYRLLNAGRAKHYTVVITDTGHRITHYGPYDYSNDIAEYGAVTVAELSERDIELLYTTINTAYISKVERRDYTSMYFGVTELPGYPYIGKTEAKEIVTRFYDSEKIISSNSAKRRFMRYVGANTLASADAVPEDLSRFRHMYDTMKSLIRDGLEEDLTAEVTTEKEEKTSDTYYTDIGSEDIKRPNGEVYKPREILGHTDVALLRELRERQMFVRLSGPPGAGKTALAEAAFGDELITVSGHGDATVASFVGSWMPRPNRQEGDSEWIYVKGPLTRAMENGSVLLADEATRFPTEVMNILFSATDGRKELRLDERPDLEPVIAQKGFYVVLGYNPETLGANQLDEALTSRFGILINVETDFATARLIGVPTLAVRIAEELFRLNKNDIRDGGPGVWVPQMRELISYRNIIDAKLGEDFALSTLAAACPREMDLPQVVMVIKELSNKNVKRPSLGTLV